MGDGEGCLSAAGAVAGAEAVVVAVVVGAAAPAGSVRLLLVNVSRHAAWLNSTIYASLSHSPHLAERVTSRYCSTLW